jgi:hypothetical protein
MRHQRLLVVLILVLPRRLRPGHYAKGKDKDKDKPAEADGDPPRLCAGFFGIAGVLEIDG